MQPGRGNFIGSGHGLSDRGWGGLACWYFFLFRTVFFTFSPLLFAFFYTGIQLASYLLVLVALENAGRIRIQTSELAPFLR